MAGRLPAEGPATMWGGAGLLPHGVQDPSPQFPGYEARAPSNGRGRFQIGTVGRHTLGGNGRPIGRRMGRD